MGASVFMTGLRSALVALGCITSAQADVTEQNLQRPCTVDAQSGKSLRQALNRATPIAVTGQRFHGYTRWNVR